jgi:hypothetical protein
MEPENSIQNILHIPFTSSGLMPELSSALCSEEPSMYEGDVLLICNAVHSDRALGSEEHIDYILRIEEHTNCRLLLLAFAWLTLRFRKRRS